MKYRVTYERIVEAEDVFEARLKASESFSDDMLSAEEYQEPTTLYSLKKDVEEEIEDRWEDELKNAVYIEDSIHELVDGWIPIYNHDLLEVAKSDLWLAVEEPEMVGVSGGSIGAIQGNLYTELYNHAMEVVERLQENDQDQLCDDCGEEVEEEQSRFCESCSKNY